MSAIAEPALSISDRQYRQILGLQFFTGNPAQAVARMNTGGLLVVPAAPALKDLPFNAAYREALLNADLTIPDSGFMVLLWNFIQRDNVPRISGLAYVLQLLKQDYLRKSAGTFWIMSSKASRDCNFKWLHSQGIVAAHEDVYVAPVYGSEIDDSALLERLRIRRPNHIIVTIGGGTQERLGLFLKRNLDFRPAIHCVGAALSFLSGDQVRIPIWADTYYMGWLFRCLAEPRRYVARYWGARKLLPLMLRYRDQLPSPELFAKVPK